MRPTNKKNGKPGKPIKGSLIPFKSSDLEKAYKAIKGSEKYIAPVLLDHLRELMKDSTAFFMEDALRNNNRYTPIPDNVRTLIYNEVINHCGQNVASFVDCAFLYFNGQKPHLVMLYKKGNPYQPKEVGKAIAQARAHIRKAEKGYIREVHKMLVNCQWENLTDHDYERLLTRYEAISLAIDYFCNYFLQYYKNGLPSILPETVYKDSLAYDNRLSALYTRTTNGTYRRKKEMNTAFSTVSQECAAYIISQTYFIKKIP